MMKKIMTILLASAVMIACEKEPVSTEPEIENQPVEKFLTPDWADLHDHEADAKLMLSADLSTLLIYVSPELDVISNDSYLDMLIMDHFGVTEADAVSYRLQLIDDYIEDDIGTAWPIRCYWWYCSQHNVDELICVWEGF